jgi:hypothetical protein
MIVCQASGGVQWGGGALHFQFTVRPTHSAFSESDTLYFYRIVNTEGERAAVFQRTERWRGDCLVAAVRDSAPTRGRSCWGVAWSIPYSTVSSLILETLF